MSISEGVRIVKTRRRPSSARAKSRKNYRKNKSKIKRLRKRYMRKASVRRRMKRLKTIRKKLHIKPGSRRRLRLADTGFAANLTEVNMSFLHTKMLNSYLETMLWSSMDNADEQGGDPLDKNYGIQDIAPSSVEKSKEDIEKFVEMAGDLLDGLDDEQVGHDLWLTRNRHGAGFWDGDYEKEVGDKLTDIAHELGEVDAYVGDDKQIYAEGNEMKVTEVATSKKSLGKSEMVKMLKEIEFDINAKLDELGIKTPDKKEIPVIAQEYSEAYKSKEDGFNYPEMINFKIESGSNFFMSLIADGRIIPEGKLLSGKGISREDLINRVVQDATEWANRAMKSQSKKEDFYLDADIIQAEGKEAKDFLAPFIFTSDDETIFAQHGIKQEDVVILDDNEDGIQMAKLSDKMAEDLARTFEVFTDGEAVSKYEQEAIAGVTEYTKEILAKEFPGKEFEVSATVSGQDSYTGSDALACYVTIEHDGQSKELEPSGLHCQIDPGVTLGEAAKSWPWAFLLGDEDSPFYDDAWAQDYITTELYSCVNEMTAYLEEGDFADDIKKAGADLTELDESDDGTDERPEKSERLVGTIVPKNGEWFVKCLEGKLKDKMFHIEDPAFANKDMMRSVVYFDINEMDTAVDLSLKKLEKVTETEVVEAADESKLKKGDVIKVISGQVSGKTGVVNRVDGKNVNVFLKGNDIGIWFQDSELKKIGKTKSEDVTESADGYTFTDKESQIKALTEFLDDQGKWKEEYIKSDDNVSDMKFYMAEMINNDPDWARITYDLDDSIEAKITDLEAKGVSKKEIIKMLIDSADPQHFGNVFHQSNSIASLNVGEVEDQVSGISGQKVNGKESQDVFEDLCAGLTDDEKKLAARNMNNAYWDGESDCIYIDMNYDTYQLIVDEDEFLSLADQHIADMASMGESKKYIGKKLTEGKNKFPKNAKKTKLKKKKLKEDEDEIIEGDLTITAHIETGEVEDFHIDAGAQMSDEEATCEEDVELDEAGTGQVQFSIKGVDAEDIHAAVIGSLKENEIQVTEEQEMNLRDKLEIFFNPEEVVKESTDKKVASYNIVDHGVENSDYFQGHGIAMTKWDECATGIGMSEKEALEDALEQLAQNGWELSDDLEAEVAQADAKQSVPEDSEDMFHYVSVDVKGGSKGPTDESSRRIAKLQESINEFNTVLSSSKDEAYAAAFKAADRVAAKLEEAYTKVLTESKKTNQLEKPFDEFNIELPDFDHKHSETLHEDFMDIIGAKKTVIKEEKTDSQEIETVIEDIKQIRTYSKKLAEFSLAGKLDEAEAKQFLDKSKKYLSEALEMISEEDDIDETKKDDEFEKLVKTLKKEKKGKNPWALAHWILNKKNGKTESISESAVYKKSETYNNKYPGEKNITYLVDKDGSGLIAKILSYGTLGTKDGAIGVGYTLIDSKKFDSEDLEAAKVWLTDEEKKIKVDAEKTKNEYPKTSRVRWESDTQKGSGLGDLSGQTLTADIDEAKKTTKLKVGDKVKLDTKMAHWILNKKKTESVNEDSIDKNVKIYDNGGKTADRYTAVYMDQPEGEGMYASLGMSADPSHPQGVGQHGPAKPGPHLGKIIKFSDLPKACQKAVKRDLSESVVEAKKTTKLKVGDKVKLDTKNMGPNAYWREYIGKDLTVAEVLPYEKEEGDGFVRIKEFNEPHLVRWSGVIPVKGEAIGEAKLSKGQKVKVSQGSGVDSGKTGVVVDKSEVKTDGSGKPTNIKGAYKPVDWSKEVAVKLDSGEIITMFKNRLVAESAIQPIQILNKDEASSGKVPNYSLKQLQAMKTIHQSQFDNLKFDDGQYRVWLSRMQMADGMPYDNQVTIETLRNGVWTKVKEYEGK